VTRLPGVGRHTEARLVELGARTVGQLAALGRPALEAALGNRGLELLALARGQGPSGLRAERFPGSLSQEVTLDAPEADLAVLAARLSELARRLEAALQLQGIAAGHVALKLRYADGETVRRSQTLERGVGDAEGIEGVAAGLLARTEAGRRTVRLLGIGLASFAPARRDDRQLELFPR
jgi:DNA polymerase-4